MIRRHAEHLPTVLTIGHSTRTLEEFIRLANQEQIVLMCAEAVPWHCHRSLIADALVVRGICTEDMHECDAPPGPYAYALCQGPGYLDHISAQALTEHEKEAVGQMLPPPVRHFVMPEQ